MPNSAGALFNLGLWRKKKEAPKSEMWKWDWGKWAPLFAKFYRREAGIKDLECPVCGQKDLYAYFEVFYIARGASIEEERPVYVANRYFGCYSCKTQVRDYGEVPRWVKDEDIHWVSENARTDAEQDLARINLKLPTDKSSG